MSRRISFWIALCSLLGAMPARAGHLPPGYFIDDAQLAAERPADRVVSDGDFTLAIHRKYPSALGAHLLDVAEALYPPRDVIVDQAIQNETEMGSDSARTSLWWQDGVGIARVPYAVTAGAIAHYTGLTDRFRAHDFRGAWDHNLFWTDFKYEATIEPRDHYTLEDTTLTNVFVAEMALSWSYDDGTFVPVCNAHRIVVMSKDGSVLYVQGDGFADEQVSMSSHRGIGRVQSLSR